MQVFPLKEVAGRLLRGMALVRKVQLPHHVVAERMHDPAQIEVRVPVGHHLRERPHAPLVGHEAALSRGKVGSQPGQDFLIIDLERNERLRGKYTDLDAGVLNLHRYALAIRGQSTVHLRERGRGDWGLLKLREQLHQALP